MQVYLIYYQCTRCAHTGVCVVLGVPDMHTQRVCLGVFKVYQVCTPECVCVVLSVPDMHTQHVCLGVFKVYRVCTHGCVFWCYLYQTCTLNMCAWVCLKCTRCAHTGVCVVLGVPDMHTEHVCLGVFKVYQVCPHGCLCGARCTGHAHSTLSLIHI